MPLAIRLWCLSIQLYQTRHLHMLCRLRSRKMDQGARKSLQWPLSIFLPPSVLWHFRPYQSSWHLCTSLSDAGWTPVNRNKDLWGKMTLIESTAFSSLISVLRIAWYSVRHLTASYSQLLHHLMKPILEHLKDSIEGGLSQQQLFKTKGQWLL